MSISIFKKAAALVCSAATALSLSAALSVSAAGLVFTGDKVQAKAGDVVTYAVTLSGNTGFQSSGVAITHDAGLEVQGVNETNKKISTLKKGEACGELTNDGRYHAEKRVIGFSTMGSGEDSTANGVLFTVDVKVPDDAKPGDKYNMDLELPETSELKNAAGVDLEFEMVDGWIEVIGETTTSSEETTTTTTSSTSSEETTTTTTVSEEPATDDTTDTTTTVSGSESGATDSTSNNNGGSDVPGPKAGEAGAALAIAGLLTAAGAAYAVRRKH